MRFARKAKESDSAAEVIVADFTPKDKQAVIDWLNKTLELDQSSDSDHPLKGIITVSTALVDIEDVHDAIKKFNCEEKEMAFAPREFIVLTELANMWKGDRNITGLDDHVRANKALYDKRPQIRDYVLSDTFTEEIKGFDNVIDMFKNAYEAVYPNNRTVIKDIDFGTNTHDGAVN